MSRDTNADFKPAMENTYKIGHFKGWVLENFPFIEADFDALTNYQLWCKVVEYLNNVIENINATTTNVTNLATAFEQLQNYVNDYFDNLDVQDEINNKLDVLAENGTLGELMGVWVTPYLAELNQKVNAINSSPLVATSTAEMTDTNRIYVNTTNGHWYYFQNNQWNDGGIYQSTGIDEDSINPSQFNPYLRESLGNQSGILQANANTVSNYYLPINIIAGLTYSFNLIATNLVYFNQNIVTITTTNTTTDTPIETIYSRQSGTNWTYNGTFKASSNANYIHVKLVSFQEGNLGINFQKLINYNQISNETKIEFGQTLSFTKNNSANYNSYDYYDVTLKTGHTYVLNITTSVLQYITSPVLRIDTSTSKSQSSVVETIFTQTTGISTGISRTITFQPTANANYLAVYLHNYAESNYTITIDDVTFQKNQPMKIVSNASGFPNSIESSITDSTTPILIYPSTYIENIGERNSILPELIGISNISTIIQDSSGNYNTPTIQGAKVLLNNLKITEIGQPTSTNGAYCLHIDNQAGENTHSIIENCIFENPNYWILGIGTFENQIIEFNNCIFKNTIRDLYMHNGGGLYSNKAKMIFNNCKFESTNECVVLQDFNGNGAVEFEFVNCNFNSQNNIPYSVEYKNYGDEQTVHNTWSHMFSLSKNSFGNNINFFNY